MNRYCLFRLGYFCLLTLKFFIVLCYFEYIILYITNTKKQFLVKNNEYIIFQFEYFLRCNDLYLFFFFLLQMLMSAQREQRCAPGSGNASTPLVATSASATKALTCNTSMGNTSAQVLSQGLCGEAFTDKTCKGH